MTRRSFILAVLIGIILIGATGLGLAWMFRYEPRFYMLATMPAGAERERLSGEFASEFTNKVLNGILNEQPWKAGFSQDQLNSYFEEDFLTKHSTKNPLPEGVSQPRMYFGANTVRLGFRYGSEPWATVVNLEVRPWLAPGELNALALEILSLRAGAFPISAQTLLERVSEAAKSREIDVSWYRYNGHPVIVLKLQANKSQPTFQMTQFEVQDGILHLAGQAVASTPR